MSPLEQMLSRSILLFVAIPLAAFGMSLLWKNKDEKPIAAIVLMSKGLYLATALTFALLWMVDGAIARHYHVIDLYRTSDFVFAFDLYYDGITAVFSIVGAILFFLVSTFSKYYMHRDEGYKRFFNTILLFALGYNMIIFSGNFETMFIGWEIIGLSSFLLIAFYRNRYLPVKNAFKVLSNYRISDVALMMAMWMLHHLTHRNIRFDEFADLASGNISKSGMVAFIAGMFLLAAIVKSAQFPFTSWLPRAMEGPTSSSAIFYGSLSVHIGVFLLLRTHPFWESIPWMKYALIFFGALTSITATLTARVQATVKTQIAYSSAAQIGLIFIEVALGFHTLALIHFAGNAFLRTYQLLVSPSVLNYLVHHQYFHDRSPLGKFVSKWKATLYVLSIREWELDGILFRHVWNPFKRIGNRLQRIYHPSLMALFPLKAMLAFLVSGAISDDDSYSGQIFAVIFISIALSLLLYAFSYRHSAIQAWNNLAMAHVFMIAGVESISSEIRLAELYFYGGGILAAYLTGMYTLIRIRSIDNDLSLARYHGYVHTHKGSALMFLISAIAMMGFPITTAFIGIDVLFTYVQADQILPAALMACCFIFLELASVRIFLRIFLGPDKKLYHPVAYRSS